MMSKHLYETVKRKEKIKREDYFENSSSNKENLLFGAFLSYVNVYFIFKENMTNSLYEDILEDYLS